MPRACAGFAGCAGGAPMPTAVMRPVVQSIFPDVPTASSTSLTVPVIWAEEIPEIMRIASMQTRTIVVLIMTICVPP
jgi:hypothetical protein